MEVGELVARTVRVADRVLARLTLPQFVAAPWVVLDSDLVATVPSRLAQRFARALPLAVVDAPRELPRFTTSQTWHARHQDDAAHAWLRATLAARAPSRAR